MKFYSFVIALGAALLSPLFTTHADASNNVRSRHVFIISFDGGKPSVMRQSAMPTLHSMAKLGAVSWNAQTVNPSITLVSHTSMLTGVLPAKHKITWNSWQPNRGTVKVPTVFQLAKHKGLKTALFAGKSKFRHLNAPGTLHKFEHPGYSARSVAAAAATYIVAQKPNLTFIHFADPDGAGHDHGWGSVQQKQAFARTDAALRVIHEAVKKAGIASRSTFILTADHGGHAKTHGTTKPEDMTIPWIAFGANVKPKHAIRQNVNTTDTAATALWLLGVPRPSNWDGRPVTSAFN